MKIKKRDFNALAFSKGFYKPQVVKSKKHYTRKVKHKKRMFDF